MPWALEPRSVSGYTAQGKKECRWNEGCRAGDNHPGLDKWALCEHKGPLGDTVLPTQVQGLLGRLQSSHAPSPGCGHTGSLTTSGTYAVSLNTCTVVYLMFFL